MGAQETRIYLAVAVATLIICVILFYLVVMIFRQQRKNIKLQRHIALGEISALEIERARIAADLHDDLGPLLAAIKFRIRLVGPLSEIDKQEISLSVSHLDDAIVRLRQISNNLLPTALVRKGLIGAVNELVASTMRLQNLAIDFDYSFFQADSKEQEVHIYRMIQEGIYNCIKHANATKMQITLKSEGQLIKLVIIDNGVGLPSNLDTDALSGRGLVSLRNRASIMGGEFYIHSDPRKGTILEFEIPKNE